MWYRKLKFFSVSKLTEFEMKHTTLLFDHTEELETKNNIEKVQAILDELKIAIEKDIRPNVPTLFSQLVTELKTLSYEQYSQLITMVRK